jgi:hypothetical protein
LGQECIGAFQIRGLPRAQGKGDRVAESIHQGVDLGAQPALAAADRFALLAFLGAPALC